MDPQSSDENDRLKSLLLEEYKHLCESYLSNEELGERRVTFFLTLTTAVIAAIVAIQKGVISVADGRVGPILVVGLVVLLMFGIVTLVRIIRRNERTDEYLQGLAKLRKYFVKEEKAAECLVFNPYGKPPRHKREKIFSLGTGGLVEMVALMNSLIVAALFVLLINGLFGLLGCNYIGLIFWDRAITFIIWLSDLVDLSPVWILRIIIYMLFAVGGFVAAWAFQMEYVRKHYDKAKEV